MLLSLPGQESVFPTHTHGRLRNLAYVIAFALGVSVSVGGRLQIDVSGV